MRRILQSCNTLVQVFSATTILLVMLSLFACKDASSNSYQSWNVPDPLYTELLGNTGNGLSTQGALVWPHLLSDYWMTPIAQQYGIRYSSSEMMSLYASRHWNPLMDPGNFQRLSPLYRKYGMKGFWYPLTPGKIAVSDGRTFFLPGDAACRKAAIDSIKDYWAANGDVTWGIYTSDEMEFSTWINACTLFWYFPTEYPAILTVDQDIKTKYGAGKYGMPLCYYDTNPYRWRAFNAWVADQIVSFQSDVYDTVKALNPDVKVVSNDQQASLTYPIDRTRMRCDILTGQTYAAGDPNRCRGGYEVKMMVDLSNASEVWPCMHVENYPACFTPDDVLEELSQAVRNGATGWHLYPCDENGRSYTNSTFFADEPGAPERWKTIAAVTEEARLMKRPIYPTPDFAIMYSADSYGSEPNVGDLTTEMEYAYTLLGAHPRAWFKFIDDLGISRNEVDLSKYKAVFVPLGKYERSTVAQSLVNYAKNGGTLVSCDPEIFSNDINDTDITSLRSDCFGVTITGTQTGTYVKSGLLQLPFYGPAYNISVGSGTTTLATFPDGKPAIVMRNYGTGRAVYFAFNPFTEENLYDDNWIAFFKSFERSLGITLDQKIWRFQFPTSLVSHMSEPTGRCLTNNYGFWRENQPLTDLDFNTGGSYTLSMNGDLVADTALVNSFDTGKLTDRLRAWNIGNAWGVYNPVGSVDDYAVKYTSTAPVSISFDFAQARNLTSARVFYAGELPSLDVNVSDDNVNWNKVASVTGGVAGTGEWLDATASGAWGKHRYMKLSIPARSAGNQLMLSEVEAWSDGSLNAPSAPSNLTAHLVNSGEAELSWSDNSSDESGFKVERKTGSAGAWAEIATVAANVNMYRDIGLALGNTYYYRVRSYNPNGYSSYSNEANVSLETDNVPPVLTLSLAKKVLSPGSYALVDVGFSALATDNQDTSPTVQINVYSNEDEQAVNDRGGTYSPDAVISPKLKLRAEHKLRSNGRVYLIVAKATDSSGNSSFDCRTVMVLPYSVRNAMYVVSKEANAASAYCLKNKGAIPAGFLPVGVGPVVGGLQ